MGYCMFTFFLFRLTDYFTEIIGQVPLVLALLNGNCPLIFKHTCSFSKHSVLFPRLIYKCFITLFSTSIFDSNFETFCSCKFFSCVLKSTYILLILRTTSYLHCFSVFILASYAFFCSYW